jgi:hypothetical protein
MAGGGSGQDKAEITFVSNFYDIKRGEWNTRWRRTADTYMDCFRVLARVRVPLIVYIHDVHYERARSICDEERNRAQEHNNDNNDNNNNQPYPPLTLIPYNEAFLKEHIRSWSYLETEAAIMETAQYREWTRGRSTCPETHDPKYNCINHAKIDFIRHAMQHGGFVSDHPHPHRHAKTPQYYGWVDFGYLKPDEEGRTFPENGRYVPNPEFMDPHKVTLVVNAQPDPAQCTDPVQTLVSAPELFTGCFWFGGRCALMRYWDQYHAAMSVMHAANVADDDQAVMALAFGLQHQPQTRHNNIQILQNHMLRARGWFSGFVFTNLHQQG